MANNEFIQTEAQGDGKYLEKPQETHKRSAFLIRLGFAGDLFGQFIQPLFQPFCIVA